MTNQFRLRVLGGLTLAAGCLGTVLFAGQQTNPAPAPPPAQTQTQTADITGKWHFVFDTEGGDREFDAVFKLDGDKVSGKWMDHDDIKGTFADGKLSLEFSADSPEVGPGTLKIDGQLAEDTLTGNWSFQTYDGTFKATRTKESAT